MLILVEEVGLFSVPAIAIDRSQTSEFVFVPSNPEESAMLMKLAKCKGKPIGIAFELTAFLAEVSSVRQRFENARESIELVLVNERADYGAGLGEIAFGQYSADDIAKMRVRRVLLNEQLGERSAHSVTDQLNDATLEAFVRGVSAPLKIEHSPFPGLFKDGGADVQGFLTAARLTAVLMLRLSGAIETITRLELQMLTKDSLKVVFDGTRPRLYVNEPPTRISVEGNCQL